MYDGNKDNGAAQRRAYERRSEIKVGDRFLWHFKDNCGMFSGKPGKPKAHIDTDGEYTGDKILTVIAVYEGHNWFGNFVDYWLNESGEWDGTFNQVSNHAYIINGMDAFKMEGAGKER